jgi:hypothetical protein
MDPNLVHDPLGQNKMTQHRYRKISMNKNNDLGQLQKDMDVSLDWFESKLDKLSVKSKNAPIGICMKSWQPLKLGSILQSESNIQNVLDLDSFFPCTKSDVMAWWRILERFGLGPQSIPLILHIFHIISTHGFIQSSNSENKNA